MKLTKMDTFSFDDLDESEYSYNELHYIFKKFMNFFITIGIMVISTLTSFIFRYVGFHETNIIIVYILGVLIVAKQTDGYFYGILSSVIGVLTFNFFFTKPYYTFIAYDPEYPITFVVMLIAAIITSTLTVKAKNEAKDSNKREKMFKLLYYISKSLLKIQSFDQIADIGGKTISKLFNRTVIVSIIDLSDNMEKPSVFYFSKDDYKIIFNALIGTNKVRDLFITGDLSKKVINNDYSDSLAYYIPIKGYSRILGIIGISCIDNKILSNEQKKVLEAITMQITLALEREYLAEKQNKVELEVEKERLRGNLLRAMSHDLRTPLTGILGSTATILDNDNYLDKNAKIELLHSIYDDASWLMNSVENILNITSIDEGRLEVKKNMELAEEIVIESVSRIKKLAINHTIEADIPDDLIMLSVDGILIEQVLFNLLDNALKYTPMGSLIVIKTYIEENMAIFEVSDNGNGLPDDDIPYIFNRFYTVSTTNDSGRRGTGLGLAICKSIIVAHSGKISVYNNLSGGATFKIVLPLKG